jgi:hypothetical protein
MKYLLTRMKSAINVPINHIDIPLYDKIMMKLPEFVVSQLTNNSGIRAGCM